MEEQGMEATRGEGRWTQYQWLEHDMLIAQDLEIDEWGDWGEWDDWQDDDVWQDDDAYLEQTEWWAQ